MDDDKDDESAASCMLEQTADGRDAHCTGAPARSDKFPRFRCSLGDFVPSSLFSISFAKFDTLCAPNAIEGGGGGGGGGGSVNELGSLVSRDDEQSSIASSPARPERCSELELLSSSLSLSPPAWLVLPPARAAAAAAAVRR